MHITIDALEIKSIQPTERNDIMITYNKPTNDHKTLFNALYVSREVTMILHGEQLVLEY